MNKPNARAGFTLLELVIAVAVLAILAAIAVPSYAAYVSRTEQHAAALEDLMSQAMEKIGMARGSEPREGAAQAEVGTDAESLSLPPGNVYMGYALPDPPEGMVVDTVEETTSGIFVSYARPESITLFGYMEMISFIVTDEAVSLDFTEDEGITVEEIDFNGQPAVLLFSQIGEGWFVYYLLFGDPDTGKIIGVIGSNIDRETILSLAETIEFVGASTQAF